MSEEMAVVDIGDRRELFVDDFLVAKMTGAAELRLHRPVRREIVFRTDAPWEGCGSGYQSVFRDGDRFRLYYRGGYRPGTRSDDPVNRQVLCLAESTDGRAWTRPELGRRDFGGTRKNNIVLDEAMVAAFGGSPAHTAVFRDSNPACPDSERYKVVITGKKPRGLYLLVSPDGVDFRPWRDEPFMTEGAFDSQNLAFWDPVRGEYRLYHRGFRQEAGEEKNRLGRGRRDILTSAAPAFDRFPPPRWLAWPGSPAMALYTNQVQPYCRAPHILVGFPMRYCERGWSGPMLDLPGSAARLERARAHPRYGMTVTDAVFMSSRDGVSFNRRAEAFIRPGPRRRESWVYGDNFIFWGLYETPSAVEDAPAELNLLAVDGYWEGEDTAFRRYTLRVDGFVSLAAPWAGGQLLTRPFIFRGGSLSVNAETSAFGSFQVEIQDGAGRALPGFSLDDCEPIFGDTPDFTVRWKSPAGGDLRPLAGRPVRLRFRLCDADIYSFRFVPFRPEPAWRAAARRETGLAAGGG